MDDMLLEVIKSSIFQNITSYGITSVLDVIKNKITEEKELPIEQQLIACLSQALEDTCISLNWEYDSNAIEETVFVSLLKFGNQLTIKKLRTIIENAVGQPVDEKVIEQWTTSFIIFLSSTKYTHLREFLKMQKIFDLDLYTDKTNEIPINCIFQDDCNEFANIYNKKLFWSTKQQITLDKLYVPNSYYLNGSQFEYSDLNALISCYICDNLVPFLRFKGANDPEPAILLITGYPGCGKTSLISKLAYEHLQSQDTKNNLNELFFIDMSKLDNNTTSLDDITGKLQILINQFNNKIIVMDGLDEFLKTSDNGYRLLNNLARKLHRNRCKGIITCRSNFFTSEQIQYCLEIKLAGFSKAEAKIWLENYQKVNSEFDLQKWINRVEYLNEKLVNVVLIPLILYICVEFDIDIGNISSLGQLYDLLFHPVSGQIPTPSYKDNANYDNEEWKKLRNLTTQISILMYQNGKVTKEDIVSVAGEQEKLEQYFGLDFYVNNYSDSTEIYFAHSSIWQYFFAEKIYTDIKTLLYQNKLEEYWGKIEKVFVLESNLDNSILSFITYFLQRDKLKNKSIPTAPQIFIDALMLINTYNFTQKGNVFDWITCLWRELYKIVTVIFSEYYPNMKNILFKELSSCNNIETFIRYTNLSSISPLSNTSFYNISECRFDGINLSYTYMFGNVVRGSSFRNAKFVGTILKAAYADNCDFSGSDFREADLKNTDFTKSNLSGCNFNNSRLNGANMSNADLSMTDLRNARLIKIKLHKTKLYECKIDVDQMQSIGLDNIFSNNMKVYYKNKLLSDEEAHAYFKEKFKVIYALWKKDYL